MSIPQGKGSPVDSSRVLALVAAQSTGFNIPAGSGGNGAPAEDLSLDDLFSLRRPKNVMSGASSGIQSLCKGVGLGDPQPEVARASNSTLYVERILISWALGRVLQA